MKVGLTRRDISMLLTMLEFKILEEKKFVEKYVVDEPVVVGKVEKLNRLRDILELLLIKEKIEIDLDRD